MNSGKTKRKKQSSKSLPPSWDHVRRYPTRLFHTLQGPVIGQVEKETAAGVRIWAPARLACPTPSTVIYLPVAFVETWLDLRWGTMFGTSDIPAVIRQGYAGYFEEFLKGSYTMAPVAVQAGIDAKVHETVDGEAAPELEPCPACHQGLSAWNAHYPVMLKVTDGEPVLANGDNGPRRWACEMMIPDIRERFPNYDAPRPLYA